MNQQATQDHAFVIDTLAHLIRHLASASEEETGNKEILFTVIANELQYRSEQLLKT